MIIDDIFKCSFEKILLECIETKVINTSISLEMNDKLATAFIIPDSEFIKISPEEYAKLYVESALQDFASFVNEYDLILTDFAGVEEHYGWLLEKGVLRGIRSEYRAEGLLPIILEVRYHSLKSFGAPLGTEVRMTTFIQGYRRVGNV